MSTLYSFNLISAAIHKAVMSENNGAIILSEGEDPIDVDIVFVHASPRIGSPPGRRTEKFGLATSSPITFPMPGL
jgi:hypothetical protein